MKDSIKLSIAILLLASSNLYATDYFWVGGSGSWNDLNHWATSSGGSVKHTTQPSSLDNVFFDANSFTSADQVVNITFGAVCRSMDWTGVTNNPVITSFFEDIDIHGSLIMPSTVIRDFMGDVHFKASAGSFIIDLDNLPLRSPVNESMHFEGAATWTLQDGLILYNLVMKAGTLNTNGHPVELFQFTSSGTTARTLTMGNSTITCNYWDVENATNFTVNAGTSIIKVGEEFSFSDEFNGAGLSYHHLEITGNVTVTGANTFNTITIHEASQAKFESTVTQTIAGLVSNGTEENPITINSTTEGVAAQLVKSGGGTVNISFANIQDNAASGGTFIANNSVDLGNVTGWTIAVIQPTDAPSSGSPVMSSANSVGFIWDKGNGAKRLVVARLSSTTAADPTDDVSYTGGAFGLGSQIGVGNYVVYVGNGEATTVTGLSAGTEYSFRIYEFNGSGSDVDYLVSSFGTITMTTLPSDAIVMSNTPVSVCSGTYYSSQGPFNHNENENFTQTLSPSTPGNKIRLTFNDFSTWESSDVLKIYDGDDTSDPLIGSYSQSTSPAVVTATNEAGALTLKFVSSAFNSVGGWEASISCITLDSQPTIGASSLTFSDVQRESVQLTWSKGNGTNRIVVAREEESVTFVPADGAGYVANAEFGSGQQVNTGEYVVYNGSGNTFNLTGLTPGARYYFAIFEYKGANTSSNYLPTPLANNVLTSQVEPEPTVAASNFTTTEITFNSLKLSWTKGNGARRIVMVAGPDSNYNFPEDGTGYEGDAQFGEGASLGSNAYVVYNGTGEEVTITNLEPGSYHTFYVFEYNGEGGSANYLAPSESEHVRTMKYKPTESPTGLTISNITSTTMTFSWSGGNGDGVILIAREGGPIDLSGIKDSTSVSTSESYGSGSLISNGVALNSWTSPITISGFSPSTTYHFAAVAYNYENGNPGATYFRTEDVPVKSATTLPGKTFYWVGGSGKWTDYSHHWATTSGGKAFHTTVPTIGDDVIFNEKSFTENGQTVHIDTSSAYCKKMDWSSLDKSVVLTAYDSTLGYCYSSLNVSGSMILSPLVSPNIYYANFNSSKPGNIIDMAGHNSFGEGGCGSEMRFDGFGGDWTIVADSLYAGRFYVNRGHVIAQNMAIMTHETGIFSNSVLDLHNSWMYTFAWYNRDDARSNGGTLDFYSCCGATIELNQSHISKVIARTNLTIMDGGTIDNLEVSPGSIISLDAGKTFQINNLTIQGDVNQQVFIKSTVRGTAATISKSSGTLNAEYVLLEDNIATGGAVFNANNSVVLSNVTGWNVTNPDLFAPTRDSYNLGYAKVLQTEVDTKWDRGSGTGRILVARKNLAVNALPQINTIYTPNRTFGLGDDLGDGNFVVYNGNLDTVSIIGLEPNTKYHFAVFEYNAWNDSIMYAGASAKNSVVTIDESDVVLSNEPVTICNARYFDDGGSGSYEENKTYVQTITPATAGSKLGVLFTQFYTRGYDNIIVYDGVDTSAPVIGQYYSYDNIPKPIIATNSSGALTFRFQTYQNSYYTQPYYYNGWEAQLFCATTLAAEPTIQVSDLQVTAITGSSITLSMNKGNGAGRLIVAKEQYPVDRLPVDYAGLSASQSFGEGTNLGNGNYIVYSGPEESVTITGLKGLTTYYFAAVEYNGSAGSTNFLTTDSATIKDVTRLAEPTLPTEAVMFTDVQANSLSGSMKTGNGIARVMFARKGAEVTFVPQDGVSYAWSNTFGSGTDLGDGTYLVYATTGQYFNIVGLEQSTQYFFRIYEYNANQGQVEYQTSESLSVSQETSGPKLSLSLFSSEAVCPNALIFIDLVKSGTFSENEKFTIQLSDAEGDFTSPVVLIDKSSNVGSMQITIPDMSGGENYRVRAVSSSQVISNEVTVKIIDLPEISISFEDGVLTSNISDSIQWLLNNEPIPDATEAQYGDVRGGSYTAKVEVNGCSRISNEIVITSSGQESITQGVKIYPMPAEDELIIEANISEPVPFTFTDINGREVITGMLAKKKSTVNISQLPAGFYIVRIHSGNVLFKSKVIKK